MPPVRTLLFLVPLVKALRPSTTPAKQLSTASSMKARVASQKAVGGGGTTQTPQQQQLLAGLTLFWEPPHFLSLGSDFLVNFVRLTVSCCFLVFSLHPLCSECQPSLPPAPPSLTIHTCAASAISLTWCSSAR